MVSVPPGSLFCPELVAWKPGSGLIFVIADQSQWLLLLAQALVATSRDLPTLCAAGDWFKGALGSFMTGRLRSPVSIPSPDFGLSLNKKLPGLACRACGFFTSFLSIRLISGNKGMFLFL